MARRRLRLVPVLPVLVALFVIFHTAPVPTQVPAPATYGIQAFGPAGAAPSEAHAITDFGQFIVGQGRSATGADHAIVLSHRGFEDLGTLGGSQSMAFGAYYGRIVGRAQTASGRFHAFLTDLWAPDGAAMVDLGTLGGTSSVAYGVEYSTVVGTAQVTGDTRWQAFIHHTGGTMSALPINRGGDSVALDVLFDQVVGYACTAGNASCGAFWIREGQTTMLQVPANSAANAINGHEQIVGAAALAGAGSRRAFLYTNGVVTNLGTLGGATSEALDINERGQVVGTADNASGQPRAFLWRNGTMTDLNTLLPSGSGWVLHRATGISDGGQISGVGTLNGVKRGFLLTPPIDLLVWDGGQRSQETSNLPMGVEAGRRIRFIDTVYATPDPLTVYGARLTATLTGPARYVTVDGLEDEEAQCQLADRTITCEVPAIDTVGFGHEYWFTIVTTGPGPIQHRVSVTSPVPEVNPSNNTVAEDNYAVALADLTLTPSTLAGGKVSSARVELTGLPPRGDAVVRLSSSRPDVAPVPSTLIVPAHANSRYRAFNIVPAVVSQATPVNITATYGGVTVTRTLTVVPPALSQLYLTPTTVIGGCGTSSGKILLTGAAPSGGAVVPLSNTNTAATVPATVTVPAGASSQTFTVRTSTVTTNRTGTVTASYGGVSQALTFIVRPIRVKTLTLSPNPVTGGSASTASVVLECPAPAGGVVLALSSSNGAVATPAVTTLTIPAGATSGSFTVRTSRVAASTSVNIYATAYGVRKSAALTVRP